MLELGREAGVRREFVEGADRPRGAHRDPSGCRRARGSGARRSLEGVLTTPQVFLVAVDGVTDPQNLGAILRTAEVAGNRGRCFRDWSASLAPAAVKAAAGGGRVPADRARRWHPAALEQAGRAGVWSVGLDGEGPTSVHELPVADTPVVLVLGAEGGGLSRLARDRCDVVA